VYTRPKWLYAHRCVVHRWRAAFCGGVLMEGENGPALACKCGPLVCVSLALISIGIYFY
jgi:hypothetical protein